MPDIRIVCEQCGSDRFVASANTPFAEIVHSLVCAVCAHPVKVDDVIIFKEGTYMSGAYETISGEPYRLNDFDI